MIHSLIRCSMAMAAVCLSWVVLNAEPVKQPNIIVVFTDDHGWADLGAHGVLDDVKTPHLDAMAASGVRFNSGYITAPQCIPSRAGIISGSYQQRFGTDDNRHSPMPADVLTVPERLQKAGYTTGMVGKWHLDPNVESAEWLAANTYRGKEIPPRNERRIPQADSLPYKTGSRGFDEFFEGYIYDYWANFDLEGNSLKSTGQRVHTEERDRLDIQSDAAMAFIERNHADPFFLYLAYFAPHVPLESTEKYLSRFPGEMPERRRYALAMISAVDEGVGRIRKQLNDHGLLEDTLIFFIGDNGAPLKFTMEDIPLTHKGGAWDGSMNTPLNGEKGMLAEGGIRVPYVLSWPGRVAAGQVSDVPVSSLDVGATVVELARLQRDEALDGENIFELLKYPAVAAARPLFWRFWGQAAMRLGDWKYLRAGTHEFLFNLADDISEQNNLIKSEPERVASMRAQWSEWNDGLKRPFDGASHRLNDQEQKFYSFYFGAHTESVMAEVEPTSPKWIARNAQMEQGDHGLRLVEFGKDTSQVFITVNHLDLAHESTLRVEVETAHAGSGRVQVRYRGESLFQPRAFVDFNYTADQGTLSIPLPLKKGQTIEHLRLFLPFAEQELSIRAIDVFSDGRSIHQWSY
ncbi:MAG: sulfatase [Lentimonas sp.]